MCRMNSLVICVLWCEWFLKLVLMVVMRVVLCLFMRDCRCVSWFMCIVCEGLLLVVNVCCCVVKSCCNFVVVVLVIDVFLYGVVG